MPTYDYQCEACGPFSAVRRISERDAAVACPECGTVTEQRLMCAPQLTALEQGTRLAHQRNEEAAHAPKHTRNGHGAGCSCCSSGLKKSRTVTAADGSKAMKGTRPWMISH